MGLNCFHLASHLPTISGPELEEVPYVHPIDRGPLLPETLPSSRRKVLAPLNPKLRPIEAMHREEQAGLYASRDGWGES